MRCTLSQEWLEKYWDLLVFVEGSIYQLDEANEDATNLTLDGEAGLAAASKAAARSDSGAGVSTSRSSLLAIVTAYRIWRNNYLKSIVYSGAESDPFSNLKAVLQQERLLDSRVAITLQQVLTSSACQCHHVQGNVITGRHEIDG